MQMKKFAKKSACCNYRRAGIKPRKISNYKLLKFVTLNFIWYTQSSDRKSNCYYIVM